MKGHKSHRGRFRRLFQNVLASLSLLAILYSLSDSKRNERVVPKRNERADAVVEAITFAFDAYWKSALAFDELRPISQSGENSFCNTSATLVDSLSTLWLAGLDDRFKSARDVVAAKDYTVLANCNLFEATIRIVGGLLSAGALSKDQMFFEKAKQVVELMMPSFNTVSGIPCNSFPLPPQNRPPCASASIAEAGTLVMEFAYLSQVTADASYVAAAELAMFAIASGRNKSTCLPGIYSTNVNIDDGTGQSCWGSMGGGADSFYEYLLKIWLLTGKAQTFYPYKRMWDLSMKTTYENLLRCSDDGHLYAGSGDGTTFNSNLEHLACFLGGNMLLGDPSKYLKAAAAITESCVAMYTSSASKLGADGFAWRGSHPISKCIDAPKNHENPDGSVSSAPNLQRPETIESLFYLYQRTRNPVYRDLGWEIFKHLNQTRVETGGFASVWNVNQIPVSLQDKQQSFYLAEELKYALLLFEDDHRIDLDQWVFNTEAHPLPIFQPQFESLIFGVCDNAPQVCA